MGIAYVPEWARRVAKLPPQQARLLWAILDWTRQHPRMPSVREMCELMGGRSTATIHAQLEALERKGFVRVGRGQSRSLEIVDPGFCVFCGRAKEPKLP